MKKEYVFWLLFALFFFNFKTARDVKFDEWIWQNLLKKPSSSDKDAIFHAKDSILTYTLKEARFKLGNSDTVIASIYHKIGVNYYYAQKYDTALIYYDSALFIRYKLLNVNDPKIAKTYGNKATTYIALEKYSKAKSELDKALDIYLKAGTKDSIGIGTIYKESARCAYEDGDFYTAIDGYEHARHFLQLGFNYADCFKHSAIAYDLLGDFKKSLENHQKALLIFKQLEDKDGDAKEAIPSCFHNIAMAFRGIGKMDSAFTYFNKALANYNKIDTLIIANTYVEIAKTYLEQNSINSAQEYTQKSLALRLKVQNKQAIIESYTILAKIALKEKQYNQSLNYYNKAIAYFNEITGPLSMIEPLEGKALILSNIKDYQGAYVLYAQLDSLYNQTCYKFQDEKSKFNLAARAFPMYEKAILTALKCFEKTKDSTFNNTAFSFMDKSKATVLKQAITDSRAKKFVGISDELMLKESESELKSHIAYRQKQADENLNDITRQALFDAKDKFQRFIKDLETQYPNYYKLKYAIHPLSISDIQKQLPKDMLFISYFWGDSTLIRCVITKTTSRFYTQPITNQLDSAVTQFTADLKNSNTKTDEHQNGHYLYQQLLEQPLKDFNAQGLFKRLRIIPDGKLNYLPFSALTETPITNWEEKRNQKIPFLVRKYAFSYDYFADSLKNQVVAGNFIGFGVDYTSSLFKELKNSKLQVLPNAKEELESITNIFSGDKWFNDKATKENFLKHTQNVGVVHIVAHTATDDKSPLEFGIALSPNKDTNSLLKGRDLLAFQMTAQLVTLSACSTGEGELKRGEGVMSLAKAFEYIGCKSVMMSLWSIPDGPTSNIMKVFYQNLKNKDDKDIAFQKAQLHYLNNKDPESSDFAMPNKWAACVLTGSIAPVEINESFNYFWLIGIIALFVGGFWFLFKNRQSSEDF